MIQDHVEEAVIGITSMFCALVNPKIHDILKDDVLYLGKRVRRKEDVKIQRKSGELSPNFSILRRSSVIGVNDFHDFRNSLLKLPFGNFDTGNNLLSKNLNEIGNTTNYSVARYFLAETQFLKSLTDISERLQTLSKFNRQKTLIAELAIFNHSLPAKVCLPLWCRATSISDHHHRIVRISPNDAVVLNSAERVTLIC